MFLFPQVMTRYSDSNHGSVVLTQLHSLRSEGLLTDVSLQVNADLFPCHRSVLAACSPYFKAMFTGGMSESRQETVALQDVESSSLRLLLDFLYTGNIILDDQNVQDVFITSNLLQVVPLIHFCAEYLEKSLSIANCIGMYCLATVYSCTSLLETSWEYINYNFILVSKQDEFLNAPGNVVQSIASSRMLNVSSEGDVFEAMFKWYEKDPTSKVCTAQEILKHVNMESLDRTQVARARKEGLMPLAALEVGPATADSTQGFGSRVTCFPVFRTESIRTLFKVGYECTRAYSNGRQTWTPKYNILCSFAHQEVLFPRIATNLQNVWSLGDGSGQ